MSLPRPGRRALIPAALLVALAAFLAFRAVRRSADASAITASGTVEATEAQLGFQVPGRLDSLFAREGDSVRAGQPLARLDAAETRARLDQARAQEASARAVLAQLVRGPRAEEIAQARAAYEGAGQRRDETARDFERHQRLLASGAVSQQAFDRAQAARDLAESQFRQSEEQYRMLRVGTRRETIDAQRAQVAQAAAVARAAEVALANLTLCAPFPGTVTVRHRESGEVVSAGAPVFSLMNPNDRWVRIYIPEDRIGAVRIGQAATIVSDSFHGRTYAGVVTTIASQAEFTPKNVQTRQERVKLVYAVKVRITSDPRQELKPGLPADVRLPLARS